MILQRPIGWLIIPLFALLACNKEEAADYPNLLTELATIEKSATSTLLVLEDTQQRLRPRNMPDDAYSIPAGERVYITYTLTAPAAPSSDQEVTLHTLFRVLTKKVETRIGVLPDTIPNNPLKLESIWKSGNYINVQTVIHFFSKPHLLALYHLADRSNLDTLHLELRHGLNGDAPGVDTRNYASFRLADSLVGGRQPVVAVKINSTNHGNRLFILP